MRTIYLFIAFSALCLASACGGEAAEADTNTPQPLEATFANVYGEVIKPNCSCHLAPAGAGGLAMVDEASAHAALVESPTTTGGPCDGNTRVISGSAEQSALYRKITGTNLCGSQMPLGGTALSAEATDLVKRWIGAGAVSN